MLPNGKTDINNAAAVSMDFVTGGAERYAKASSAERADLWHAHEDYQRGLYYFLQNDPRVAPNIRADLALWGLPRDEFRDTQGWPTQLYVREARRMIGTYVMRQSDYENPPARLPDSVGLGTMLAGASSTVGRWCGKENFMTASREHFPLAIKPSRRVEKSARISW
jgi:hypothetical protein